MDVHPIFVHFPIALLTIYALAEILTWGKLKSSKSWFNTKAFLAIIGTLATIPALASGDAASEGKRDLLDRVLVHAHETYAQITTAVFAAIALIYLIQIVYKYYQAPWFGRLSEVAKSLHGSRLFMIIVALLGLALVTIVGALGGAIVYGPDADPIVSIIYKLIIG